MTLYIDQSVAFRDVEGSNRLCRECVVSFVTLRPRIYVINGTAIKPLGIHHGSAYPPVVMEWDVRNLRSSEPLHNSQCNLNHSHFKILTISMAIAHDQAFSNDDSQRPTPSQNYLHDLDQNAARSDLEKSKLSKSV